MKTLGKIAAFLDRRAGIILAVEILLLLGGGVAYSIHLGPTLAWADPNEDSLLAENMLKYGAYTYDGSQPASQRAPGSAMFLLLWKICGAGVVTIRVGYFCVMAMTLLLLYRLVSDFASPAAGVLSATAVLLYPVQFYVTGTLYPQPLGAMLLMMALWMLAGRDRLGLGRALLGGVAFGLGVLTIPTFLLLLAVVLTWLIFRYRRQAVLPALAVILPVVLIVGAWTYRNYLAQDSFVPVSTNGGLNFLYANNENASPYSGVETDIDRYRRIGQAMPPDQADRYYRAMAMEWIWANPSRAGHLYFRRLIHYFGFYDEVVTKSQVSLAGKLLMYLTYGPLLGLLVIRLCLWRRYPPVSAEKLLIWLYLLNAVATACFVVRIRYRLPLDYLLIAVVGVFVANLLSGNTKGASDAAVE